MTSSERRGSRTGLVADQGAQLLGAVGEGGAVEPDAEGPGHVAAGLDDGVPDGLLLLVEVVALELSQAAAAHGRFPGS